MIPADRRDANRIADAARKMIDGNRALAREMNDEWSKVKEKIDAHIKASKKRWKVYEAHHLTAVARLAMLTAFVDGKPAKECVAAALERVGIDQLSNPTGEQANA